MTQLAIQLPLEAVHDFCPCCHRVDLRRVHEVASVEVPKLAAWVATIVPPEP